MQQLSLFNATALDMPLFMRAQPAFMKQATDNAPVSLIANAMAMVPPEPLIITQQSLHGQEVAKRAMEIAVTGGHPLALPAAIASPAHPDFLPCEQEARLVTLAYHRLMMRCGFGPDKRANPHGSPLLTVEIELLADHDRIHPPPCDSDAEVAARIAEARQRIADHAIVSLKIDEPATRLLDHAQQAIGFNDHQRAALVKVADTIAHMAVSDGLRRIHIAEALNYWPQVRG